jgi:hypothetical protein
MAASKTVSRMLRAADAFPDTVRVRRLELLALCYARRSWMLRKCVVSALLIIKS